MLNKLNALKNKYLRILVLTVMFDASHAANIHQPSPLLCQTLHQVAQKIIAGQISMDTAKLTLPIVLKEPLERLVQANNNVDAAILLEKLEKPKNEQDIWLLIQCGGSEQKADELIQKYNNPNKPGSDFSTLIFDYCYQKNKNIKKKLLEDIKLAIDAKVIKTDEDSLYRYLHEAIMSAQPELLRFLLKQKNALTALEIKKPKEINGKKVQWSLLAEALQTALLNLQLKYEEEKQQNSILIVNMILDQNPQIGELEDEYLAQLSKAKGIRFE